MNRGTGMQARSTKGERGSDKRDRERERERDSLNTRISRTFAAAVVLLNESPTPITGETVSTPVADFHSVNSSLVLFPGRQQTLGLRILLGTEKKDDASFWQLPFRLSQEATSNKSIKVLANKAQGAKLESICGSVLDPYMFWSRAASNICVTLKILNVTAQLTFEYHQYYRLPVLG